MGVYINGMEMPTDKPLTLMIYTDGTVANVYEDQLGTAVPVPPHGDLIERDKLLNGDGVYLVSFQKSAIDTMKIIKAPTIIPAEESE